MAIPTERKTVNVKARNGQMYQLSPETNLGDFVIWAAVNGYRVKWARTKKVGQQQ